MNIFKYYNKHIKRFISLNQYFKYINEEYIDLEKTLLEISFLDSIFGIDIKLGLKYKEYIIEMKIKYKKKYILNDIIFYNVDNKKDFYKCKNVILDKDSSLYTIYETINLIKEYKQL